MRDLHFFGSLIEKNVPAIIVYIQRLFEIWTIRAPVLWIEIKALIKYHYNYYSIYCPAIQLFELIERRQFFALNINVIHVIWPLKIAIHQLYF